LQANAVSGVAVSEECVKAFQELRAGRAHRFVVYKLDDDLQQVVVDKVGGVESKFDDLAAALPADDCRYAVYDLEFLADDSVGDTPRSKIFFISWSPETADIKSKMVYASSNEGFKKELDGVQYDVQATDPSELTLDILKSHAT
jgi:cofilin